MDFLGGFLLLVLQIGQIRLAEGAADGLEVELDVALLVLGEHAQQEAAELLAARTAQAMAPPDRADAMLAAIAFLRQEAKLLAERVRQA